MSAGDTALADPTSASISSNPDSLTDSAATETSSLTNPTDIYDSSHAAFIDKFGAVFTILSCGIAGYQIL